MATYESASRSLPSDQRVVLISDVAEDDRIDLVDVLGRPATKLVFQVTDTADQVVYKLNTIRRGRTPNTENKTLTNAQKVFGIYGTEAVTTWAVTEDFFEKTGALNLEVEGIQMVSIEIVGLSLSSGTTINIEAT